MKYSSILIVRYEPFFICISGIDLINWGPAIVSKTFIVKELLSTVPKLLVAIIFTALAPVKSFSGIIIIEFSRVVVVRFLACSKKKFSAFEKYSFRFIVTWVFFSISISGISFINIGFPAIVLFSVIFFSSSIFSLGVSGIISVGSEGCAGDSCCVSLVSSVSFISSSISVTFSGVSSVISSVSFLSSAFSSSFSSFSSCFSSFFSVFSSWDVSEGC